MIPDWAAERRYMVESQLRRRGIRDRRVLGAMLEIPREEFVPVESRIVAYRDEPIHIGCGPDDFAAVHDRPHGRSAGTDRR